MTPPSTPKQEETRSSRKTKKTAKKQKDIDEVWEEQIRLKEEAERLEMEYRVAKKMAKELKQKMKEQEPLAYGDPAFSDLLSPDTKDFLDKIKPIFSRTKDAGKDTLQGVKRTAKKSKVVAKIAANKTVKERSKKKFLLAVPVVAVIGLVAVVVINKKDTASKTPGTEAEVQSASTTKENILLNQTPEFPILLPADKTAEQLGGIARVSPTNAAPAYTIIDAVDDTKVRITQQQLPSSFKDNTAQELEKTAKGFNATRLLQVDNVGVYIGKSEKGPQTLIFIKEDLLVFLTAEQEKDDIAWVQYISRLKLDKS